MKRETKIVLWVLGGIVLVHAAMFLILNLGCRYRLLKTRDRMQEQGYYQPVTVNARRYNVAHFGAEHGAHSIVMLPGIGVYDAPIAMQEMMSALEEENTVLYPDRPGTGGSEGGRAEMTAEQITEDTRTMLKAAGYDAPYLLIAHNEGGIYASYWQNTYPDEIEGVVFLAGTILCDIPENQQDIFGSDETLTSILFDLSGISSMGELGMRMIAPRNRLYDAEQQRMSDAFALMHYDSFAPLREEAKRDRNISTVYNQLTPNDIPKLYLAPEDMDTAWLTDYQNRLGNCTVVPAQGSCMLFREYPETCGRLIELFLNSECGMRNAGGQRPLA